MAVGPGGTIHVVWEDYQMGPRTSVVHYAKSDNGGASFTVGIPIVNFPPLTTQQKFPSVAVSSNGWIHVVWTDLTALGTPQGAGVYYARSKTAGNSFEASVPLSDAAMDDGAEFVVPRVQSYGSIPCQLHVVWAFGYVTEFPPPNPIFLTYDHSADCGNTFGPDLLVDPEGYNAALDVASDGTVGVAYVVGGSEEANIYFRMKVGPVWQNRVPVSQPPISKYDRDPTVAFDPSAPPGSRTVHVVWADGRDINIEDPDTLWNLDIFLSKAPDGVSFGPNVRISDPLGPDPVQRFSEQSEPWLDVDANGNPRVAWTDWRNDDNGHREPESPTQGADVFFDESSDGGATFGTDQRMNDDPFPGLFENSRPMLATVSTDVDIVWQDGRVPDFDLDVYFAGTNVPLGSTINIKANEVLFEPVCPGEPWVEFVNKDTLHVNMRGMEWTEEDGFTYRFPSAMPMVPPDAYVVVHVKAGTDETYFGQSQSNAIHMYAGDPGWQRHSLGFLPYAGGVVTGDFDRDGDIDIGAGEGHDYGDALYVYFRPADPTATWSRVTVDSGWGNVWALAAGNIDDDDDLDLLAGSSLANAHLTWYENVNPTVPGGWIRHTLESTSVDDVAIRDIDNDGFVDLIASGLGKDWYESDGTPRDGGWTRHTIDPGHGGGIAVAPYDGDLLPDVFGSRGGFPEHDIGWYKNGLAEPWPYTIIREASIPSNIPALDAGDLDGDGDIDVASGVPNYEEWYIVSWYENRLDESTPGWTWRIIDTDSFGAGAWGGVEVEDVDRDGKPDIVVSMTGANAVTLFRNNLGGTPSWIRDFVDTSLFWPVEVSIGQIDGDCWWDVAATEGYSYTLYWYTRRVLDARDQVSLYTGPAHSSSNLVDFVAWGGDAVDDDDIAVAAWQWQDGAYVNTVSLLPDQSIGRDASSTDTDTPADWTVRPKTPGALNA